MKSFHLVLNGREICQSCLSVGFRYFELPLRIRLLVEQALRAIGFGVCGTGPDARFDLGLSEPAPLSINAAVFDVNLRCFSGCGYLKKRRQNLTTCDVLSDARQGSIVDHSADRGRDDCAIRR